MKNNIESKSVIILTISIIALLAVSIIMPSIRLIMYIVFILLGILFLLNGVKCLKEERKNMGSFFIAASIIIFLIQILKILI